MFVPPDRGSTSTSTWATAGPLPGVPPAAQLVRQCEQVEDRPRDQIEYPDEDPSSASGSRASWPSAASPALMPDEAYKDRDYQWTYQG